MVQAFQRVGRILALLALLAIPALACSVTISGDGQKPVTQVAITQVVVITQVLVVTKIVPVQPVATLTPSLTPVEPDEAQPVASWQPVYPPLPPAPRMEVGSAYDEKRRVIVMVGGTDWTTAFAETWEYDGANWILRKELDTPGRIRPAMAYDSDRQVMVLFGGSDLPDNTFFDETWEYNGRRWVQRHPLKAPSGRKGAAMAYDPLHQSMVLFGGYERWGATKFFDDTWEYVDGEWVQRFPAHHPEAREATSMVFDAARGKVVLFGGGHDAGSVIYGDTWEWDGEDWVKRLDLLTSPPARWAHLMAYDEDRQRTILFGGLAGVTGQYGDTWEYDGHTWQQIFSDHAPAARWDALLVYDPLNRRTVLFGGQHWEGQFGWYNDTWHYQAY